MKTEITLIRHGEPTLQNALLGSTDVELSTSGWQQLSYTFSEYFRNKESRPDVLISSPLKRCANFATHFADNNHLPLQLVKEWRECNFGDWDGQPYDHLHSKFLDKTDAFFRDPFNHTPPNGETLNDFIQRSITALQKLLSEYRGKNITVLTHAGVIRNLVGWCVGLDLTSGKQFQRFSVDYASVQKISVFTDEENQHFPQLQSLNHSFVPANNLSSDNVDSAT